MKVRSNLPLCSIPVLAVLLSFCGCLPPARFENEYVGVFSLTDSDAAVPSGMRRTKYGWEDASLWHVSANIRVRSIDWWMADQRSREPRWLRTLFAKIRTTPPLMIAVIQITAVAAIIHISWNQKLKQPS